jgi:hypothetical protein
MLYISLGKKKIEIPNKWEELKIKDWIEMLTILNKVEKRDSSKDDELSEEELEILKAEDQLAFLGASKEIFAYLAKLTTSEVGKCSEGDTAVIINAISTFLTADTAIKQNRESFKFKGTTYYFPKENMKESTFEDFIEASQLDLLSKKGKAGRYDVVAEQMAILCRAEGEEFDTDKIAKKKKMFRDLTMDVVWDFVFFLTKRASTLSQSFQMSLTER